MKYTSVLLKAGSDVKAKNNGGKAALDCAKNNESIKGTQAMKELEEATNPASADKTSSTS